MSSEKVFVAIVALAACITLSRAHPTPPRAVDLADAINRTVCPIEISYDDDPNRIPRRIKLLKCAPNPTQWCIKENIPNHECCAHTHNHHVMECVEIHDKALVQYPNSAVKTKIYDVAVGCTCMVGKTRPASTLPPP